MFSGVLMRIALPYRPPAPTSKRSSRVFSSTACATRSSTVGTLTRWTTHGNAGGFRSQAAGKRALFPSPLNAGISTASEGRQRTGRARSGRLRHDDVFFGDHNRRPSPIDKVLLVFEEYFEVLFGLFRRPVAFDCLQTFNPQLSYAVKGFYQASPGATHEIASFRF
jgi:hypothetical protein